MKCPVCSHELVEYQAGPFNVDICRDGCSGIWFDKEELDKCDEHSEAFPDELLRLRKFPNVVIDRSKPRGCPCCAGQQLARIMLDAETRFEIDRCPKCQGHWLDNGELERMRKLSKSNAEIEDRIRTFEKQASAQLKDVDTRRRILGFFRLIGS